MNTVKALTVFQGWNHDKHNTIRETPAEKKQNDQKKEITVQTTKYIASPTDADVIVFVNNTQLDAADQLRL